MSYLFILDGWWAFWQAYDMVTLGAVRCRMPYRQPGCSSGVGRGSCGLDITHRGARIGMAGSYLDVP